MPSRARFSRQCARAVLHASPWRSAALILIAILGGRAEADDVRPSLAAAPRIAPTGDGDTTARGLAAEGQASKQRIQQLIRQLGSPRFSARRAAANELRQIGAESFDLLHVATSDADPEVAASARYLLRQITVRWVQNDDSPMVRALLRDFGGRSDDGRLSRIQELAKLPDGAGLAGLCRIARFDRSPLVSRMAALAVIRPEESAATITVGPEVVDHELDGSTREAALWLRRYLEQLRDPAASIAFWEKLVEEEAARLEQNADDTSAEIVLGLLWNLADLHRRLDNREALLGVLDQMVGLNAEEIQPTAIALIEWLLKHENWKALDAFLTKHQPSFEQNKRLLYHAALARVRQGKSDLAEELAEKAAQLDPQGNLESFIAAKDLEEHSQFPWAVREYHRAIDNQPIESAEAILARISLAAMQHDYEHHRDAADVLEPLVKAVQNEGKIGQLYTELLRFYRGRLSLPEPDAIAARFHYYRACQHRDAGDRRQERDELELAIKFDPTDADVLIAMYRHPDSDPQWRELVRQRIRDLCRQFEQEINDNPNDPTPYNQWAWLVSNTEGDFQQAIRFSHRSLELIPPGAGDSAGASFLDTLGRCYYAAGDLKNAVKYQRQAIQKIDYLQVMQRQLALFEKALADEQGAGSKESE